MYRERWWDKQGEEKGSADQAPHQQLAQMLIKSSPFSTDIHPQTACPPRRPLALQPTTAHLLPPRWNLTVLPPASAPPPLLQHSHSTWFADDFNPRKEDEDEGEGRRREDAERWRETTTVGRKERRRRCASGKPGSKQPASGLAREFPQSCSSPYLLLLLLHWSVCAFVWWVFVCGQETERKRHWVRVGNKCLCVCVKAFVDMCLYFCVCELAYPDAPWHSSNTLRLAHQMLSLFDLV